MAVSYIFLKMFSLLSSPFAETLNFWNEVLCCQNPIKGNLSVFLKQKVLWKLMMQSFITGTLFNFFSSTWGLLLWHNIVQGYPGILLFLPQKSPFFIGFFSAVTVVKGRFRIGSVLAGPMSCLWSLKDVLKVFVVVLCLVTDFFLTLGRWHHPS